MAVTIIFETCSNTFDNENGLASGWNDVRLSPTGLDQAREVGARYRDLMPDAVFCSDLQRSIRTAMVAFDSLSPKTLYTDWRLRECNYGDMDSESRQNVEAVQSQHIDVPFANGESYQQCAERVAGFLADIKTRFDGKVILIVGHRATQYSLEHWLNNQPLADVVGKEWQWQPGWRYTLQ